MLMPNIPFFEYQNPYNQIPISNQNNLTLNAYLEIQNKLKELETSIKNIENRLESLENQKNNKSFEYQTSMNMV